MHISERPRTNLTAEVAPASADEFGLGAGMIAARRRKRRWIWGSLLATLVAAGAIYVRAATSLPVVAVVEATPTTAERILAVTGRVQPRESVAVVPRVAGQVVELTKDEGDLVTAGETIGRIDDARARAALAQADAAVEAQRRSVDQAERDLERARALRERGTVTATALEAATLAVTRGREDLRRFQAADDEARARLDEYVIRAPLTGRILSRPVDPGQVVSANATIFEIAPMIDREIETEVDETYSMALALDQPARLAFAGVSEPVPGTIAYLSPRIDTSTGGRIVRLAFTPPKNLSQAELPVGLSVDVNIVVERRDGALTLPRTAVREPTIAPHVLVVEDGKVARRDIEFRDWPSANIIVDGGLRVGERVIVSATPPPVGTKVEVSTQ
ncbi:MAG: efflux RND transporter periplasmic adaptor subunit [Rhodospirillaceae bacterium]|nr:efflux RND transporter periplasmic adaptor subunit [Rhodospirillaceae bacterium]